MPDLYPFQAQAKRDYYDSIRAGHRSAVLRSATGSGKTVMAGSITEDVLSKPSTRILFSTHRDTIANQTRETFSQLGPIGLIMGQQERNPDARIQIAGVLTLPRRLEASRPADRYVREFLGDGSNLLCIHDEGHLTGWTEAAEILMSLPKARHLYLTATPCRLRKDQGMGDRCTAMIHTPHPDELQAMGFLSPMRYFGSAQKDAIQTKMGSVKKDGSGEYKADQVAAILDTPEYNKAIVAQWRTLAHGRRTIAFTSSRAHSRNLALTFQAAGIPAAYVDGETDEDEAAALYEALAAREILVICSCEKLAEGFDVPSVSCVILARRTASLAKHIQQIGRGARIFKGERWKRTPAGLMVLLSREPAKQDCIVLDYAGNCQELGYLETRILWTLDKGQPLIPKDTAAREKQCQTCQALNPSQARSCWHCKSPFGSGARAGAKPGSLTELDPRTGLKPKKKTATPGPQGQTGLKKTIHTMSWQDIPKGKPPTHTRARLKKILGYPPADSVYLHAIYGPAPTAKDFTAYLAYLTRCANAGTLERDTVITWLNREFGPAYVAEFMAPSSSPAPASRTPAPPTPKAPAPAPSKEPDRDLFSHNLTHSPAPRSSPASSPPQVRSVRTDREANFADDTPKAPKK